MFFLILNAYLIGTGSLPICMRPSEHIGLDSLIFFR